MSRTNGRSGVCDPLALRSIRSWIASLVIGSFLFYVLLLGFVTNVAEYAPGGPMHGTPISDPLSSRELYLIFFLLNSQTYSILKKNKNTRGTKCSKHSMITNLTLVRILSPLSRINFDISIGKSVSRIIVIGDIHGMWDSFR